MNSQHFTTVGLGYIIAEAAVDETMVSGIGGVGYPRLIIPLKLHFNAANDPGTDYCFSGLDARLYHSNAGLAADALPIRLRRVLRSHPSYAGDDHLNLEFPLDARRISQLEILRDGKDLPLRLDLTLAAEEHGSIPRGEKTNQAANWGLRWHQHLTAQLTFTVPRSVWIERVLAQVGHGVVHVVELSAVPIEACKTLQSSYDGLRLAQTLHNQGLYDEAVMKCRIALEPFFDQVPVDATHKDSRRIPKLKPSWEMKLGKATAVWLNDVLVGIKQAANPTAHSSMRHFDQFESQMIQAITTTVIAYAARTMTTEGKV